MRSRKIPSVVIVFGGVLLLVFMYIYFNQFADVPAEKPQAGATEHVTLTPLPPTPSATFIPPLVVHRATAESEEHFAQILPDCNNDFALYFDNNIPALEDQDGVVIFCQNDPGVKPNTQAWHGQVNSDNQIEYSPLDMAPIENTEGAFIFYESLKPGQTDSIMILEWNPELTLDGKKDGPKYIAYNHTGEPGNEQKYVIPDPDSQSQNINSVLASVNPPPEPEKHPDRITSLLTTYNPPNTDISINLPTTIEVSTALYERKTDPWHTVTERPSYKSNENGEDGADAMAHVF